MDIVPEMMKPTIKCFKHIKTFWHANFVDKRTNIQKRKMNWKANKQLCKMQLHMAFVVKMTLKTEIKNSIRVQLFGLNHLSVPFVKGDSQRQPA